MVQRPGVRWGEKQGMSRHEFEVWWEKMVSMIKVEKDVDGLTAKSRFLSATVKAVEMVLEEIGVSQGRMVVVGSQGLVGRRLVEYFTDKEFKVEGVDVDEKDLGRMTSRADVLISATGQPGLIKAEMVKQGAVVIDVGWPKGDVKFGEVKEKASVMTPVPGGIGPLTVVSLLENLTDSLYNKR
jgi:methylenetetrahydrofolate dehydrogenase (NADP+)/methenyltetrahydrofolate cyclohydrolase